MFTYRMDDFDLVVDEMELSGENNDEEIEINEDEEQFETAINELIDEFNIAVNGWYQWLDNEDNCWILFGATFMCIMVPG